METINAQLRADCNSRPDLPRRVIVTLRDPAAGRESLGPLGSTAETVPYQKGIFALTASGKEILDLARRDAVAEIVEDLEAGILGG
jgi:hypothetical protein